MTDVGSALPAAPVTAATRAARVLRSHLPALSLVALALLAALVVLYATALGIGAQPDSTAYVGAASRWLARLGLPFVPGVSDHYYAPGYSMLLAAGALISSQPLPIVARALSALLFALNVAAVGLILRAALPHSFWTPLLGAMLVLTSPDMLGIHTMALSEPPYLFASLAAFYLTARYLQRPRPARLVVAALALAASLFIRYPGAALIVTAFLAIFLLDRREIRARVRAALGLGALLALPLIFIALYLPRQARRTGSVDAAWFLRGFTTFASGLVPGSAPFAVPVLVLLALALVAVLAYYLRRARAHAQDSRSGARAAPVSPPAHSVSLSSLLLPLIGLYTFLYLLVFVGARAWVIGTMQIQARYTAVLLPPVLIAVLLVGTRFVSGHRLRALALGLLALGLVTVYLSTGLALVDRLHREGQDYARPDWLDSETLRLVAALPADTLIYSNGDDAIYYLLNRSANRIPDLLDYVTQPHFDPVRMEAAHARLLAHDGVVVYFDRLAWRPFLPQEDRLRVEWNLQEVARGSDGRIYRLRR